MTERLLNSQNWKFEAEAVINDIKEHVIYIKISEVIQSSDAFIYLNVKTIEDEIFCIQLSAQGFKVVGNTADQINVDFDKYFETPYALLNEISPKFEESFANALFNKLNNL